MSWQAFKIITFIIIVIIIITADLPFGPHQYIHIWHHTAALGQSGTAANIHSKHPHLCAPQKPNTFRLHLCTITSLTHFG